MSWHHASLNFHFKIPYIQCHLLASYRCDPCATCSIGNPHSLNTCTVAVYNNYWLEATVVTRMTHGLFPWTLRRASCSKPRWFWCSVCREWEPGMTKRTVQFTIAQVHTFMCSSYCNDHTSLWGEEYLYPIHAHKEEGTWCLPVLKPNIRWVQILLNISLPSSVATS